MIDERTKKSFVEQCVARPTLAQVARAAGVDKSTASRALRDDPAISQETRIRVQQVAAHLHYVPNAHARRLSQSQSFVLAVGLKSFDHSDNADPFLMEMLAAITHAATEAHYDVLLSFSEDDSQELLTYQRILGGMHADGVILMDMHRNDPRLDYLCAYRYPHVLFGRSEEDLRRAGRYPYPWVEVDNRHGARLGTEHLIDHSHTRIAFIGGGSLDYFSIFDRHHGYRDALQAAHIPFDPALLIPGPVSEAEGYRMTRHLLELPKPPTAIFAFGDVMAAGIMRAARELDYTVGQDLAVIGFDGLGLGSYLSPALTTLRQPLRQVGQSLVISLIAQISDAPAESPHLLLQPELVVRASSDGVRPR